MKIGALAAVIATAAMLSAMQASAADLKGETLAAHNALRAKHGVPPLTWSASLAKSAQVWADGCVFEHSSTESGENLAQGTSGSYSPAQFVNDWYSEISGYDFASGTPGSETGHFTQVVWKDTKQVGCGLAQCGGNDLLVCQYAPAGNFDGQYQDNVLPPK